MVYARERATYSQTRRPRKRYWLDTCKTYSIVQPILERMGQTGFSDLRITNFELTRTPLLFKACEQPGCKHRTDAELTTTHRDGVPYGPRWISSRTRTS